MKIYAEDTLDNLLSSKRLEIKNRIESETEDYILNVGEEQYLEYLKSEFTLDVPEIHTDKVYVDTYERDIPGNRFPMEFIISNPHKTFKKDIVVYHIPYSGSIELLKFRPSSWSSMAGYEINIDKPSRTIVLEYINFYNDAEKIKRSFDDSVRYIFGSYGHLKSDIEAYNNGLENFIRSTISARRQRISRKTDFIASLGVPIKKKTGAPQTFAVSQPKLKDKIQVRPIVHTKGFKPEPTLDNDNYIKILKIINDVGKNFERLPSVYAGKYEEHLRDHILLTLDPNFEFGSASGETFNKTGKTDIQLRYDSSVVFVAECKYWEGEKGFLATIDQLLGYLTWRDSKTSVVMFVTNKGFSSVLETAKEAVKKHPNFVGEKVASDDNWFNYTFSLPDDTNKEIQMAVQLYHLP